MKPVRLLQPAEQEMLDAAAQATSAAQITCRRQGTAGGYWRW